MLNIIEKLNSHSVFCINTATKIAAVLLLSLSFAFDAHSRLHPEEVVSDAPNRLRGRFYKGSESRIKLNWGTPLSRRQVKHFIIFRNSVMVGVSTRTAFYDTLDEPGVYQYRVIAVRTNGRHSAPSQSTTIRKKADWEM